MPAYDRVIAHYPRGGNSNLWEPASVANYVRFWASILEDVAAEERVVVQWEARSVNPRPVRYVAARTMRVVVDAVVSVPFDTLIDLQPENPGVELVFFRGTELTPSRKQRIIFGDIGND